MDWILALSIISGQLIKIPFGLGGITILDLTVILISLLILFKIKFRLQNPPLFIKAGTVFVIVCLLSLIFTPLHLSNSEFISSLSYTARLALYLFAGWLVFSSKSFNLTKVLTVSGISLAILGIIQIIFLPDLRFLETFGWDPHYFRAVSTFLDPNFLGAYLILAALVLYNKKWLFLLIYIALLLTFSRSSYLMFLVSFLTTSILLKSKKLLIQTFFLFLGLMLGFFIYTQLVASTHGVDRQASASYRLGTWQQGLNIFQKSPVLGVGFNSYRYAIRDYKLGSGQFLNARGSTTNDFSLLYVLATTGVVGLSSYLFFLGSIFLKLRRNLVVMPLLSGLLIHSFFNNSLFYPFILIWIILLSAKSDSIS